MEDIDERKLQETFMLQKEQCSIMLNGLEQICKDFKHNETELECKLIDDELSAKIGQLATEIVAKEVNLKNTLTCIRSSLADMQDEFKNFQVDEDREVFCPNYEIQLKEQINMMNNAQISKQEISNHMRLLVIKDLLSQLDENQMMDDEDFAEIHTESQLDKIPIDPFTQREIDIPLRNIKCRHVYDKVGITNYINQRAQQGKGGKCPTIGCQARLTFNDLVEDRELKEKIDRLKHME